jgi:hypothetical protein
LSSATTVRTTTSATAASINGILGYLGRISRCNVQFAVAAVIVKGATLA